MDNKRLDLLISRFDLQADRAFEAYQETGAQRYDTQRNNAAELADFLRLARDSAEEHEELIALRGILSHFAVQFSEATGGDYGGPVNDFLAYAAGHGLFQRLDIPAEQDNIAGGEQ